MLCWLEWSSEDPNRDPYAAPQRREVFTSLTHLDNAVIVPPLESRN